MHCLVEYQGSGTACLLENDDMETIFMLAFPFSFLIIVHVYFCVILLVCKQLVVVSLSNLLYSWFASRS